MSYFRINRVTEQKNFYSLALLMVVVALVTMIVSIHFIYQAAVTQKLADLSTLAQNQARLIETIARFDLQKNAEARKENAEQHAAGVHLSSRVRAEILSQIVTAFQHFKGFGRTGESVIAGLEGSRIVFLLRYGNEILSTPDSIAYDNASAEPMRRALESSSGTLMGLDYRGVKVLAAYEPLDRLNLGIVVKVDQDEFLEPFIRAALISLAVCLLVILVGGFFIFRLVRPVSHQLASGEKEFAELVENLVEWVWDMDLDGNLVHSSRKAQAILGYTAEELVGVSLYKLLKEDEIERIRETIEYSKKFHLDIKVLECVFMHNKGEEIDVELNMLILTDHHGDLLGFRGLGHDITERKTNEYEIRRYQENLEMMVDNRTQELGNVNEELRNFAYIVSHDLRSPLVSIIGFTGELEEDLALISNGSDECFPAQDTQYGKEIRNAFEERIPESLYFIKTAAEKMNRLINSILELSRIGRRELVFEDVNIQEIIDETLHSLAFQIENRKVKVSVGEMPRLNTDRLAMELIFGNLLGNALKYLSPDRGGEISVTAETQGSNTLFNIEDNGCGISAEDVAVIFELFKRVGNQDVVGEGMGLTYVRTVVRRLGGQIGCKSRSGGGARFEFTIPNMPDLAQS